MSAARSFEDFEVAPQADGGKKLTIVFLQLVRSHRSDVQGQ